MPPYQKTKKSIPCKNFISGRCQKPNCQFMHERKPMTNTVNTDVLVSMLSLIFDKNSDTIFVKDKQLLNLTKLRECPDLLRIQSAIDFNSVSFCNALCQTIREKIFNPEFLMLDDNGIKTGFHLFKAIEANDLHISLKGLCCSNNDITTFDSIRLLKNFPGLVEVKFDGNPINSDPDYHQKLRKMLPTILGIDGRGVDRDPLALPWPLLANHDEQQTPLLQQLETDYFQALGAAQAPLSGVDSVVSCYAPNAIFSISLEDDSEFQTPTNYNKQKRDIPKDFVAIRLAQMALNRNTLKGVRSNRSKLGRMDVCNALKDCVYPSRFVVHHTLDNSVADVAILSSGVKEQVAVLTVHGRMDWKHVDQLATEAPISRLFDRTMVLTAKPGQGIQITNDMLYLRRVVQQEAILTPFITSRVEGLSRRYLLPVEVVQAVIQKVADDKAPVPEAEMHQSMNAIRRLGGDLWQGCLNVSDQAVDKAITVARVVEHHRLNPVAAFHALSEVQGNLQGISDILGNYDKDQFVTIV